MSSNRTYSHTFFFSKVDQKPYGPTPSACIYDLLNGHGLALSNTLQSEMIQKFYSNMLALSPDRLEQVATKDTLEMAHILHGTY